MFNYSLWGPNWVDDVFSVVLVIAMFFVQHMPDFIQFMILVSISVTVYEKLYHFRQTRKADKDARKD